MKRIAIIGAGQSGLQLGLALLNASYEVTLYSDRSAEEIRNGHVMSSQCMFDSALETERDLGLNYWEEECRQDHRLVGTAGQLRTVSRPEAQNPSLDG
jgi:2-polyprenyl-6-methoxyphenol hydroxylase-like FAD-dependent oxidoreductase